MNEAIQINSKNLQARERERERAVCDYDEDVSFISIISSWTTEVEIGRIFFLEYEQIRCFRISSSNPFGKGEQFFYHKSLDWKHGSEIPLKQLKNISEDEGYDALGHQIERYFSSISPDPDPS